MKILYLTRMRLPTEKAYGLQMVQTMKALTKQNNEVTLLLTQHKNEVTQDVFTYYGIEKTSFKVVLVNVPHYFFQTKVGFWLHMLLYSLRCFLYTLKNHHDVLYSREPMPLLFYSLLGYRTVYEMHDFPLNSHWFHRLICRTVTFVVVTNSWAKERCTTLYKVAPEKLILAPNGYDPALFAQLSTTHEARRELNLPIGVPMVMYSGHLYAWKGVETILAVAKIMPSVHFVFVGGSNEEQENLRTLWAFSNIQFISHQPPQLVPRYLQAADVLVLPNIPITQHSEFSTSPIKLFEYMAARRPVIASRLPSIESIVTEREVSFAIAGDINSWVETITLVLAGGANISHQVEAATLLAKSYTWEAKATTILSKITTNKS